MSAFGGVSARNVLLCAIAAAALYLPFTPASAQEAITTPILPSAPNFRDIAGISASMGGTGFANTTSNDGVMRTGVFYRTDALNNLTTADWTILSSLNIYRDIDLRTPNEIYGTPGAPPTAPAQDVVPKGAAWTNINIYGTPGPPPQPPFTDPPSAAISYMKGLYYEFVASPVERGEFHSVLLTLANDPGPDLYHCSAGKDRTGWTSAILESIAGVSQATIMKDYLASNRYMAALIASTKAAILAAEPLANPATIDAALKVRPDYLETALNQVAASYGSMNAYLIQGLGLSQADIYVLRGKMVDYLTLPGQSGFVGNAAAGAAFLNALQNSPLSGHYTAYNYYLQSAVDAGTLGGVEAQVGGQVHADAAAFLLRQPQWIDEAIAPYTCGCGFGEGQARFWMAGLGGGFWSDGRTGVAGSTVYNAGTIIGATRRFNSQASADFGIGYGWGSIGSAGAGATLDTFLATIGGRYGLSTLESGPYATARADGGWGDYQSNRPLGEGLGNATGSTNSAFYSGLAATGDVIRLAPYTVTVQTGVRVTSATLNSFNESGSELALHVNGIDKTSTSVLVDLGFCLDPQKLYSWTITPGLTLGYERVLGNPQVESTGTLYGFAVSQYSAYDAHDLVKASLSISARHNDFIVKAGLNGVVGDGSGSAGIGAQLSLAYSF